MDQETERRQMATGVDPRAPDYIEDFFRLAFEATPTGIVVIDAAGLVVCANPHVEHVFGYQSKELVGNPIEMLVPKSSRGHHAALRDGFFADPSVRAMGRGRDLCGLRKDGSEVPIEIGLNPLVTPNGTFVLAAIIDITERKHAGERLAASLREKETLLREVNHRVKNNLQVISSLINMQVRQFTEPKTRSALEECGRRVMAISLVQETLYHSKSYASIPFSEYATTLARDIVAATGVSPVTLDLCIEPLVLPVDKAVPSGLILNELLTNALKHAFPNERKGVVRVTLKRCSDQAVELSVSDDGVGLPPGFNLAQSQSLGLQIVSTLVEPLDGRLQIAESDGTTFRVTFPSGV